MADCDTTNDATIARADDFDFHFSESDDVPIIRKRVADPEPGDVVQTDGNPAESTERRPARAAALKNPYILGPFKKDIAVLLGDHGITPARKIANVRHTDARQPPRPSAKALGKRKAVDTALPISQTPVKRPRPNPIPQPRTSSMSTITSDATSAVDSTATASSAIPVDDDSDEEGGISRFFIRRPRVLRSEPDDTDHGQGEGGECDGDEDVDDGEDEDEVTDGEAGIAVQGSDEENEVEYSVDQLRNMGARDYTKRSGSGMGRSFSSKTRDCRLVFTQVSIVEGGKRVKKMRCNVCWNSGKPLSQKFLFSTSSASTLRKHFATAPNHFAIYEVLCEDNKVPVHPRAVPKGHGDTTACTQTTLEFPPAPPKPQPVHKEGIVKEMAQVVIVDNRALQLIDKPVVRALIKYLNPKLSENDIPHRATITREIVSQCDRALAILSEKLESIPSKISFTFDGGTNQASQSFFAITGSWISSTSDSKWKLENQCLAFPVIDGRHDAATLSRLLFDGLQKLGLTTIEKLGWFTSDNAEVNDKALRLFIKLVYQSGGPSAKEWDPKEHRGRCLEHSLNLSASHFISAIGPMSTQELRRKVAESVGISEDELESRMNQADSGDDDDDDVPGLDDMETAADSGAESDGVNPSEDNDDAEESVDGEDVREVSDEELKQALGEALGKVIAGISQIRKSASATKLLNELSTSLKLKPLRLKLFVRTRWASMYDLTERFLYLKKALKKFWLVADHDDKVPKLKSGRQYADYALSAQNWDDLALIKDALEPIARACQSFSSDSVPSLYRGIPTVEFVLEQWEAMLQNDEYSDVYPAIRAAVSSLEKYYRLMDDTNTYVMSIVLNPKYKMKYIEKKWDYEYQVQARDTVERVFDEYAAKHTKATTAQFSSTASQHTSAANPTPAADNNYGISWMDTIFDELDDDILIPREELKRYLESPRDSKVIDVIAWWAAHQDEYPILSRIARDYLAIPASSTASERLFSSAGLIGTDRRNRLAPRTFEALQVLKSSYRAGDMSAEKERARLC